MCILVSEKVCWQLPTSAKYENSRSAVISSIILLAAANMNNFNKRSIGIMPGCFVGISNLVKGNSLLAAANKGARMNF